MASHIGKASFTVSPCSVAALAILLYTFPHKYIISVLLAVLVHELAHIALMRVFGLNVKRISIDPRGLCIDFSAGTACADAIAALAGPTAGIALYFLCEVFEWGEMTGRVSLYLSLFNLFPSLPLDGGMALVSLLCTFVSTDLCNRIMSHISTGVSLLLLLAGLAFLCIGIGPGIVAAGIWLIYCNIDILCL